MLCDDLDGWEVGIGGRFKREGIYVYIQLIYSAGKQKMTQHCKATIKKKSGIHCHFHLSYNPLLPGYFDN